MAALNWNALTDREKQLVVIGIRHTLKELRKAGLIARGTRFAKSAVRQVQNHVAAETHQLRHRNLLLRRKLIKARQQGFCG